jgi:hypothetical protein
LSILHRRERAAYKTPASVAVLAERRGTHLGPTGDAVPVPEEIFVAEERSAYRSADLGAVSCAELFAKVVVLISAVRCAHLGAGGSAELSAKEGILISAVRCAQLGHLFVLCEFGHCCLAFPFRLRASLFGHLRRRRNSNTPTCARYHCNSSVRLDAILVIAAVEKFQIAGRLCVASRAPILLAAVAARFTTSS